MRKPVRKNGYVRSGSDWEPCYITVDGVYERYRDLGWALFVCDDGSQGIVRPGNWCWKEDYPLPSSSL